MKKDSIVYVVIFTFVVCAGFVFFLALANEATKERVAANRLFAERAAVLDTFGIAYASPREALDLYERLLREVPVPEGAGAEKAYRYEADGKTFFAARVTGAGLWGSISIILGADAGVERLTGLQIVAQNETPGLGGRIDEAWFRGQFRGERIGPEGIRVATGAESRGTGDPDPDNGLLDGVSGASRTSQSMEAIVNGGIGALRAIAGGAR